MTTIKIKILSYNFDYLVLHAMDFETDIYLVSRTISSID